MFIPHTRGWSYSKNELEIFSKRLSRIRGGDPIHFSILSKRGMFIPHTRGWSFLEDGFEEVKNVYPAYAGVILPSCLYSSHSSRLSRIRGGDPVRARDTQIVRLFIPHTRGWSYWCWNGWYYLWVYPAYAGVILPCTAKDKHAPGLSRIRGGDPFLRNLMRMFLMFIPHTRGWS